MTSVTVLSGRERRRRWTAAEKLRMVAQSLSAGVSVAEFARRHDVHPNMVHLWRRQARMGELSVAPDGEARFVPVAVAAGSCIAPPAEHDKRARPTIEVVLRNGRVLRLLEGVPPQLVGQLADALDGCAR
ncbi:MAG: IS66-like element accessory protein TnpA [Hyphomicrobiales bacterium]